MKKKYRIYYLLSFLLITTGFITKAQTEPYNLFMDRIKTDLTETLNQKTLTNNVSNYLKLIKQDGSWSDMDYNDLYYAPLSRVKELAQAYVSKNNVFYAKPEVFSAVLKSLGDWYNRKPINKNWWYNDIYYPQAIGETLILMRSGVQKLPSELENKMIQLMLIKKMRTGNGANTSDEALHYLYRACLTQNKTTIDSATKYLYEPILVKDDLDGAIQVDNSYYQHGKQPAIASYGRVFVGNAINAAYYLRNTKYELPKAQMDILVNFVKNTYLLTIRGRFYDFNVRGRGISRKDSLIAGIPDLQDKMMAIDPKNKAFWEASKLRVSGLKSPDYKINPSHTFYWKTNYSLQVRPEYTFSVQTSSDKVLRTEYGNGENLLGRFLPDGATNIQRTGSEYANIMPVWEWDKIPGTTSRDYKNDEGSKMRGQAWGQYGSSKFSGGVSNGKYGITTYSLNYDSVQAKKAWFFFDNEVVCLGAGINSFATENVTTTINQTRLVTPVLIENKSGKIDQQTVNTEKDLKDIKWILQDSIGYFFPKGGSLTLSAKEQEGSWFRINNQQSADIQKEKVFKLWFNHGSKPANQNYEYIVVPGLNNASEMNEYKSSIVQVLANNADLQAVLHTGLNMLQIVFYKPGILEAKNLSVKVDKACTILIDDFSAAKPTLYISDPSQASKSVSVELKLPVLNKIKTFNCTLPSSTMAGSTASFKVTN